MLRTFGTILVAGALLAGCSAQTSDNVNFDAEKVQYYQDSRTGVCFAVVASREPSLFGWLFGDATTTGIGVGVVDCNKVEGHLE